MAEIIGLGLEGRVEFCQAQMHLRLKDKKEKKNKKTNGANNE